MTSAIENLLKNNNLDFVLCIHITKRESISILFNQETLVSEPG